MMVLVSWKSQINKMQGLFSWKLTGMFEPGFNML